MTLNDTQRKELLLAIEENSAILELYDSVGMRLLVSKCNELISTYDSLNGIKDINDLNFKKGQLDILRWFVGYGDTVREVLEGQVEIVENTVINE